MKYNQCYINFKKNILIYKQVYKTEKQLKKNTSLNYKLLLIIFIKTITIYSKIQGTKDFKIIASNYHKNFQFFKNQIFATYCILEDETTDKLKSLQENF